MRLVAGLVLALLSSAFVAVSYAGEHAGASSLERLEVRHPLRAACRLISSRRWLLGYAASWIGWGLYIWALALAPLSLVQAVAASSIGTLELIARRLHGHSSRRERVAAAIATAGIVAVLASIRGAPAPTRPGDAAVLVLAAASLGVGAAAAAASGRARGTALALMSGLSYAACDVATKATVAGAVELVPVFLLCATVGFVTLQMAYQRVTLLTSAGLSALVTNAVAIVCGVVLFGEHPPAGMLTWVRAIGFGAVVLGAVGLADRPDALPREISVAAPSA